jgi:hypothetical protein
MLFKAPLGRQRLLKMRHSLHTYSLFKYAAGYRLVQGFLRKNPKNAHFLENIEYYLKHWTDSVSKDKFGNQVPTKKAT